MHLKDTANQSPRAAKAKTSAPALTNTVDPVTGSIKKPVYTQKDVRRSISSTMHAIR